MGKLHKLRRAIRRDPEKWLIRYPNYTGRVFGAWKTPSGDWGRDGKSYLAFVQSVLIEMGKIQI